MNMPIVLISPQYSRYLSYFPMISEGVPSRGPIPQTLPPAQGPWLRSQGVAGAAALDSGLSQKSGSLTVWTCLSRMRQAGLHRME